MRIRLITALAVLVSAGVHLRMWFDGVRDQHVIGPAFMLNAVAGLVIAILLVAWRHWVPLFLGLGFGVSTLTAFTLATTVGLYGVHDHWTGGYVWTAAISEAVAIVTALAAGSQEGALRAVLSTGGSVRGSAGTHGHA